MFWPLVVVAASLHASARAEPQIPYPWLECEPSCVCLALPAPEPKANSPAAATDKKTRPRDSFAELTLFLFGGGVALFVALLGWSDQIRGINKDTLELERKFLIATKIDRQTFLSVVKPESPEHQLTALTQILASGRLKTVQAVEVLQIFQTWNRKWEALEKLAAWKYRLSIALTYCLFGGGLLSLFLKTGAQASIFYIRTSAMLLILLVPMLGFLVILTMIAVANYREMYFHGLLKSLAEKV